MDLLQLLIQRIILSPNRPSFRLKALLQAPCVVEFSAVHRLPGASFARMGGIGNKKVV
jgi:hypothetical protein